MKTIFLVLLSFFFVSLKAQEKEKDTLYFKYDNKYVYESKYAPKEYLLKDSNSDEIFFFNEVEKVTDLNPKEILCLKKIIRTPKFYDENKKQKLNNYKLILFFRDYVVFLVKKTNNKTEYIRVNPAEVIYD
ncbi:hypothetical protein SAMN05444143_105140 [Flavobacterium succinicans]|uniref:Uncharacterized protein n=1 Tax=Flavobacterium succinicans TaxID=29536 RepID=A0A1I4VRR9_9FLAO|nr:hypothetical protein [Flavobacterium succinicans]SFN03934.1 hypothetical protein SAMN05444143_105140 [Flavobacterium succinicans]